jgi:hypothetical protein
MEPDPIVPRPTDAVYVLPVPAGKLQLRIGGFGPGEGRLAFLTPTNARVLAYALLGRAELAESD